MKAVKKILRFYPNNSAITNTNAIFLGVLWLWGCSCLPAALGLSSHSALIFTKATTMNASKPNWRLKLKAPKSCLIRLRSLIVFGPSSC